jgi:ketosteroid isomerase-like protein
MRYDARTFVIALLLGAFLCATPLLANNWSSAQKEVWKTVESYTELAAKGDVDGFLKYFHEDYTGWSYQSPVPYGTESVKKWAGYFIPKREILVYDIMPVAIEVHGDFAFAHYYYSQAYKDLEGKTKFRDGRWTDILIKNGNKWQMIGDHGGETSED